MSKNISTEKKRKQVKFITQPDHQSTIYTNKKSLPKSILKDNTPNTPRNKQKRNNQSIIQTNQQQLKSHKNIITHLDSRDMAWTHKYKEFKNHNKSSQLKQIKEIIEQLLNKHTVQGHLSLSQQYILTGYMTKYTQETKNLKDTKEIINPFNINKRIQTKNTLNLMQNINQTLTPNKYNRSISKNKVKILGGIEEKKSIMYKQLDRLKFLWKMYKLKSIVCADMNRLSQFNQTQSHKQLLDLIGKLKSIQKNKVKVGEQKCLNEVQKIMKSFEQTMKKSLC